MKTTLKTSVGSGLGMLGKQSGTGKIRVQEKRRKHETQLQAVRRQRQAAAAGRLHSKLVGIQNKLKTSEDENYTQNELK